MGFIFYFFGLPITRREIVTYPDSTLSYCTAFVTLGTLSIHFEYRWSLFGLDDWFAANPCSFLRSPQSRRQLLNFSFFQRHLRLVSLRTMQLFRPLCLERGQLVRYLKNQIPIFLIIIGCFLILVFPYVIMDYFFLIGLIGLISGPSFLQSDV